MRFTIAAPIAALAASVAASELGSWNVTLTKSSFVNGYQSESVNAIFVSDSYLSPGLITECKTVHDPNATPKDSSSCEPAANGFSYEYDGTSKLPLSSTHLTLLSWCGHSADTDIWTNGSSWCENSRLTSYSRQGPAERPEAQPNDRVRQRAA
jgi:hypothetical protein